MCNCAVHNLTGSVFLGSFGVLEGAEESLAEIHREVLHFQIRLQEETEAFFIYALQKQMNGRGMCVKRRRYTLLMYNHSNFLLPPCSSNPGSFIFQL